MILKWFKWWPGTESNRRRQPFQGCALPTELPGQTRPGKLNLADGASRFKGTTGCRMPETLFGTKSDYNEQASIRSNVSAKKYQKATK
jgi:hypothetical protein